MTKQYDPMFSDRCKRQSIRQKNHNYSWSATYFVTITTEKREPLFNMHELVTILSEEWKSLPERFPCVTLDEFIVMPDHIHFIVIIEGNVVAPSSLFTVIGAYKSRVAVEWLRHIKNTGIECSGRVWQRGYFDRAIRDANNLAQTRQYIRDNPERRRKKSQSAE